MHESSSDDLIRRLCPPRRRYVLAVLLGVGLLLFYSTIHSFVHAWRFMVGGRFVNVSGDSRICPSNKTYNVTFGMLDKPYTWPASVNTMISGAYYHINVVAHFLGAFLLTRFSAKRLFGLSLLGTGLFVFLVPLFLSRTDSDYIIMIASRGLVGVCSGIAFTSAHAILSHWTPARDRGKLAGIAFGLLQAGVPFSAEVSYAVAVRNRDPTQIYYAFGGMAMSSAAVWMYFGRSNYEESTKMTEAERAYMRREMGRGVVFRARKIPWVKMAKCGPLWALCIASLGTGFMWQISLYLLTVFTRITLHYQDNSGIGVSKTLLNVVGVVGIVVIGFLSDWVINHGYVQRTTARKICSILGSMGPSIFMAGVTYSSCHPRTAYVLLTMATPMACFHFCGARINSLDLAPNFGGVVMAITHGAEMIAGSIKPFLLHIMDRRAPIEQWRTFFWAQLGVMGVTNFVFVVFGSAEVQAWNYVDDEDEKVTIEYDDESEMAEDEYSLAESLKPETSSTNAKTLN